jgi:hypothetical protein
MHIKISVDFSDTPGARYYEDGDYSGQEFFEKVLLDKFERSLTAHEKLTIDFDDCYGFASSFLSESFGRLSSEFGAQKVRENISLISHQDPLLPKQVFSIIDKPLKD